MTMAGKYTPLEKYLDGIAPSIREITLTFEQIERILNDKLPPSAKRYKVWWSNEIEGSHVQARSWVDAGWFKESVDFARKQVRMVRE